VWNLINRYVGNPPPVPGVFPNYPAPVVRNDQNEREMVMMRWGMAPPPKFGGPPVTNIRTRRRRTCALAETREPMLGTVHQLLRIRTGAETEDEKEGRGLVRVERRSAPFGICRHLH
jgi:hypothetical protein